MNTIRSTWIGWGTLCVAGGGAYFFAKRAINADRAARFEAEGKRKAELAAMEQEHRRQQAAAKLSNGVPKPTDDPSLRRANAASWAGKDNAASPSAEASHDPAPTRHEPETDEERMLEKSKYEAAQTFRPPRGNRFS
ncbi:hypothetical protein PISL3812_04380 [Talaromyces islandicus]|uniref:Uncharacterized protein n=1 Tax=Talaromyces islandicus TaxID=28573 RepID=A0A0U1LVD3_TALIS|nr:hypothetical protein PISL3812_04380 [Talaromyces islandicus]